MLVDSPVVETVEPFQGRDLVLVSGTPWAALFDQLGLVKPETDVPRRNEPLDLQPRKNLRSIHHSWLCGSDGSWSEGYYCSIPVASKPPDEGSAGGMCGAIKTERAAALRWTQGPARRRTRVR